MKLRISVFTRYTRQGASSRLRFLQYFDELERHGFVFQHQPLFSADYVQALQSGRASRLLAFQALIRRAWALSQLRQIDALWVEKDALPWLPALCETTLMPRKVPLVLDYDDAVFHHYEMHHSVAVRQLLENKHRLLMRDATLVIVGNQYLADYARNTGASWVEVLPTIVDLDRYLPIASQSPPAASTLPTVGWIGQQSTATFLRPMSSLFEELRGKALMQFKAVGIDAAALGLPMASEVWSEGTEVASIQRFDVGIMPLNDGPFERGKCGYKLIQYMACGLPVVASPVGVNTTLVEHGVNGFLATSLDEWEWALRTLARDPKLRHRMGQAGRVKVERDYSLRVAAPKLAGWLVEAASIART